jgi:hypothetical protein
MGSQKHLRIEELVVVEQPSESVDRTTACFECDDVSAGTVVPDHVPQLRDARAMATGDGDWRTSTRPARHEPWSSPLVHSSIRRLRRLPNGP